MTAKSMSQSATYCIHKGRLPDTRRDCLLRQNPLLGQLKRLLVHTIRDHPPSSKEVVILGLKQLAVFLVQIL